MQETVGEAIWLIMYVVLQNASGQNVLKNANFFVLYGKVKTFTWYGKAIVKWVKELQNDIEYGNFRVHQI